MTSRAALIVSPEDYQAVVAGQRHLVIPGQTVRECRHYNALNAGVVWTPWCGTNWEGCESRERRVAPPLPSFTRRCGTCGGDGFVNDETDTSYGCPKCKGYRSVEALTLGTEQWRPNERHRLLGEPEFPWRIDDGAGSDAPDTERRQALLCDLMGAKALPVVEDYEALADVYEGPAAVEVTPSGIVLVYPQWGGALDEDDVREADELRGKVHPGDTVITFDEVVPLPEPIVEQRCPTVDHDGMEAHAFVCRECNGDRSLPLALPVGIPQSVEL